MELTNDLLVQLISDFHKNAKGQMVIGALENAEHLEMLASALAELLACRKALDDLGYKISHSPNSIS